MFFKLGSFFLFFPLSVISGLVRCFSVFLFIVLFTSMVCAVSFSSFSCVRYFKIRYVSFQFLLSFSSLSFSFIHIFSSPFPLSAISGFVKLRFLLAFTSTLWFSTDLSVCLFLSYYFAARQFPYLCFAFLWPSPSVLGSVRCFLRLSVCVYDSRVHQTFLTCVAILFYLLFLFLSRNPCLDMCICLPCVLIFLSTTPVFANFFSFFCYEPFSSYVSCVNFSLSLSVVS